MNFNWMGKMQKPASYGIAAGLFAKDGARAAASAYGSMPSKWRNAGYGIGGLLGYHMATTSSHRGHGYLRDTLAGGVGAGIGLGATAGSFAIMKRLMMHGK